MRILRVIPTVNPAYGGPLEGLKQSAGVLLRLGHTTEIACLDAPGEDWIQSVPFLVHALGSSSSGYGLSRRLTPWLRTNLGRFDAVIVHGIWHYASFGAWRALHDSATPYFLFVHGMLDPWFNREYPLKRIKKAVYWRLAEHRVVRDAAAVLFTCEEERRLAAKSFSPYSAREVVVSYGTSEPLTAPEVQIGLFRSKFPALRDKRLILFLGRIHPKKGCDLLIDSFATLHSEDQRFHLVMAGPDQAGWKRDLDSRAKQLGIDGQITWTGLLQGDLKWGALRSAELFSLPSHQENFGIAVAEALAAGCPVAISDKVNIWREIIADDAGIVGSDDVEGTTKSLLTWFSMPAEQKVRMAQNARACFKSRFEINAVAESLLKTISDSVYRGRQ